MNKLDPAVENRILKSMNYEEPDRVPIWDLIDNRGIMDYFADGETDSLKANAKVYHSLGIDLCRGFAGSFDASENGKIETHGDIRIKTSGQTRWKMEYPIRDVVGLKNFIKEKREYCRTNLKKDAEQFAEYCIKIYDVLAPRTMFVPGYHTGFHAVYDLMGLEMFSYFIYDEWDTLKELLDLYMDITTVHAQEIVKLKLTPLYFFGDDIAYKNTLMFSPAFLRKTFIPMLKNACAPAKSAGMKVIFHSDGYLMEIIDDMISAGIDGLNPIEPIAGMDIGLLKKKYYKKLILVGNVDCSQVLPLGTKEDVINATKECIRNASHGGGHFIGSSSEITPATPVENILAFYETAREYGKYPINV